MKKKKTILTIAGSDPSGGAGIQADIRAAEQIGLYPCSVVTVLTAQNSEKVFDIWGVEPLKIHAQLECLLDDISPDAVKIGLLNSADALGVIVDAIRKFDLHNIVVDPVLALTLSNGKPNKQLAEAYVSELFPLATLVTPNIPEKEYFEKITDQEFDTLCEAFLLKGGHADNEYCCDRLYYHSLRSNRSDFQSTAFPSLNNRTQPILPQDNSLHPEEEYSRDIVMKEFRAKRISTANTHGSGCVLSTAIACYLAEEYHLEKAVEAGLKFTRNAMRNSAGSKLGRGNYGPTLY